MTAVMAIRDRGLDHALNSEALRISLRVADEVGCRVRHRRRISGSVCNGGTTRIFLDMRTVAAFRAEGIQATFVEVDLNPPKTLH